MSLKFIIIIIIINKHNNRLHEVKQYSQNEYLAIQVSTLLNAVLITNIAEIYKSN